MAGVKRSHKNSEKSMQSQNGANDNSQRQCRSISPASASNQNEYGATDCNMQLYDNQNEASASKVSIISIKNNQI